MKPMRGNLSWPGVFILVWCFYLGVVFLSWPGVFILAWCFYLGAVFLSWRGVLVENFSKEQKETSSTVFNTIEQSKSREKVGLKAGLGHQAWLTTSVAVILCVPKKPNPRNGGPESINAQVLTSAKRNTNKLTLVNEVHEIQHLFCLIQVLSDLVLVSLSKVCCQNRVIFPLVWCAFCVDTSRSFVDNSRSFVDNSLSL